MTSREIADRIAQLDWSGTSLQHQLAMSAAVVSLRGGRWEGAEVENPVGEMQGLLADLLRQTCQAGLTGSNKSRDAAFMR